MHHKFDVIVIGVGGMGSSTVYQLARRGLRVLGLEKFNIPHNLGSSHGITRIIRLCYYEHPAYVPLVRRAYELWNETQKLAGEQLLYRTGSIDAGPLGSDVFEGSRRSCIEHDLPHEILDAAQMKTRFQAYDFPKETHAVLQADGGFVLPERSIVAHVLLAQSFGAEIHARESVIEWEPTNSGGVRVRTDRGTYEAGQLVCTAGSWASDFIKPIAKIATPERQVLAWFQPKNPEIFIPSAFPVFNIQVDEGRYYGLPIFGIPGFKIGRYHHLDEEINPNHLTQDCSAEDEEVLRKVVARYFPQGAGPIMSLAPCMFTNTPDEHFVVDVHPEYPQVVFASPCSGHGFKFCSVIGEILADLVQRRETRHDISLFRLQRFAF